MKVKVLFSSEIELDVDSLKELPSNQADIVEYLWELSPYHFFQNAGHLELEGYRILPIPVEDTSIMAEHTLKVMGNAS